MSDSRLILVLTIIKIKTLGQQITPVKLQEVEYNLLQLQKHTHTCIL